MKGKKILCTFIILFVILSIFHITCFAYSNVFPDYLGIEYCAYIEVNTNLGKGAIIIPSNYQYDYLTIDSNGQIINLNSSTISTRFILQNGTQYDVRAQSLSNFQYRYTSGYQTLYDDINISTIYNTNCNINSYISNSYDRVYHFTTFEIIVICCLFTILFILFGKELKNVFRRRDNGRLV